VRAEGGGWGGGTLGRDHAGGNAAWRAQRPETPVLGADARVEALTRTVHDGETWLLGTLEVRVLVTPCHTTGSCCYVVTDPHTREHAIFTGDTVFTGA
jgi:hydroxyacylglutathione hydrolase